MIARVWSSRAGAWVAIGVALVGVTLVALFVDVSPRVEGEFFFSDDDPQMQASDSVAARFPSTPQILLRVQDLAGDRPAYRERVAALTDDLLGIEGITGGYSITTDDPTGSPLFSRILLTPDSSATNIILQADETDPQVLVPRIEAAVSRHAGPELGVIMSGVPVIVELIRRSLYRDLVVFSSAAVLVFGLIIGLVYRDVAIVLGTLATCFVSVSLTLLVVQAIHVPIGLLTANLVTIVFVLTLSHVVFLTANWRRAANAIPDRTEALERGIRDTAEGSFWSMTTTFLGFLSLLVATARPLRDLGVAGAVGTLAALARGVHRLPGVSRPMGQGAARSGEQAGRGRRAREGARRGGDRRGHALHRPRHLPRRHRSRAAHLLRERHGAARGPGADGPRRRQQHAWTSSSRTRPAAVWTRCRCSGSWKRSRTRWTPTPPSGSWSPPPCS